MSRAPAERPGPIRGPYPERDARIPTRLEETLARAVGGLGGWFAGAGLGPGATAARALREIEREGAALAALDDATLGAAARALGPLLRREGLAGPAARRAFALVREQAARRLGQRPYPVQVLAGWLLLQGRLIEMQTGEGKTLTATLPAATAALAGIPVHIVTVNDYLVTRDAGAMAPLFGALGLSVGAVTDGLDVAARRTAYGRDICYVTNKQIAFDYLRDRLVRPAADPLRARLADLLRRPGADGGREPPRLRGLCFGILDEADSVLVDEARTPLIIARGEAGADPGRRYREALELAAALTEGQDYRLRAAEREVELTDAGRARLAALAADLPEAAGGGPRSLRGPREDLVRQALAARWLFQRDTHYLVRDDKVQIIDEYTGRLMPDRSWERGLHQLIETKEGCPVTAATTTLARISYQRFFRRYLRLAGMTGTACEVAGELRAIYDLAVVRVPTHRPGRRRRLPTRVYADGERKWAAIVARVAVLAAAGRPVLIGTRSVAASERLSARLTAARIDHHLLNARQDADEACIVASAGHGGRVTVATNMAGRGTDIPLGDGVAGRGGLHVIASEYHEARRIDRQLFGRAARQGDPGSVEYCVALDDELPVQAWPRWLLAAVAALAGRDGRVPRPLGRALLRLAQRRAEARHARVRRRLLRLDEQQGDLLAFGGRPE